MKNILTSAFSYWLGSWAKRKVSFHSVGIFGKASQNFRMNHAMSNDRNVGTIQKGILGKIFFYLLISHISYLISPPSANAQSCSTAPPSVLSVWNFDDPGDCTNAISMAKAGINYPVLSGLSLYCPNISAGCGLSAMGSRGHLNTGSFAGGVCLYNFYAVDYGYNPNATTFDPTWQANLNAFYWYPAGKSGCLSSFSLKILQKQFSGTVNFEKQGIAVKRNGVIIYTAEQAILPSHINSGAMVFNFPNTAAFCADGSAIAKFEIVFGLVHRLVAAGDYGSPAQVGYDDISISGTCQAGGTPTAYANSVTCGSSGALANGKITLSGYATGAKYDYNTGSTYTGSATYATATAIPAGGQIANTLANPAAGGQTYTVRVFGADCYKDITVTLQPTFCPPPSDPCTTPTGTVLLATSATCAGATSNNNGSIAVSGVVNGDKVGISTGNTYTGPSYTGAGIQTLATGAYTFTSLANPTGSQIYTVRVYNGKNSCYTDQTVELLEEPCGPCANACASVVSAGGTNIETVAANNTLCYASCLGTQLIDLKLTKSVSPTTGTTCGPTGTNFVWTLTLQNEGTMAATDIQVMDILPAELSYVSSTPSVGTFALAGGWIIPTLAAGATATVTITTKALKAGTFKNVAEVWSVTPLNDPDSTPSNSVSTEDDYAEASITVTGPNPPTISKEFSPMLTKPNTPTRLTIKITNNESTPLALSADFVDIFPTTPAAMVIAATPSLAYTGLTPAGSGIVANAGAGTLTIPKGTVLQPGLNQVSVEITVPSNGNYCNTIAAGALKTANSSENCLATEACITANTAFTMAPLIKKAFSPQVVQTGQNSTLTITIENRNSVNMTLNQDFVDYLPTGLLASGAVSGTCSGVSITNANKEIRMAGGTVITPGTCTVIVPVTSAAAGTYCNLIQMNAMITTVGTNTNNGNEDIAEACVTVTASPCTTVGTVSFTQSPVSPVLPSAAVTLTATATGISNNSVLQWSGASGTFSNTGINPTVWTAPATAGTYTVTINVNNNGTGYGTCTATASSTVVVAATSCTPPTGITSSYTQQTCNNGVVNLDGIVILLGFTSGQRFQFSAEPIFTPATAVPSTPWLIPNDGIVAGGVVTHGVANPVYVVRVYDATNDGCYTDVIVQASSPYCCATPILASIAATPNSISVGNVANLDVTATAAGTPAFTYSWGGTGGFASSIKNPSTGTLVTAGGYSYTVTVTNSNNYGTCTATATTSLTVSTTVVACINPTFTGAAVQVTCTGTTANNDGKLTISGITNGDKVGYSTGATYAGTATYTTATLISALSPTGQVVGNLANPASSQQYTIRVYNGSNTCYTDQTVTLINKSCTTPCGTPRCGTVTITVNN